MDKSNNIIHNVMKVLFDNIEELETFDAKLKELIAQKSSITLFTLLLANIEQLYTSVTKKEVDILTLLKRTRS
ncbi:hypothetical protein HOE22_09625 [Candidatus Woesearchaeota archaeon]|jgi:hypothetical protein|nr:hypothetical protein [Candidatus Woesearchaeota archaeon]MBT7558353.1 hypothetical protein [Candidatus Woesearchaeota archaeon]